MGEINKFLNFCDFWGGKKIITVFNGIILPHPRHGHGSITIFFNNFIN